jgi:methylated-DNA-[protein]-cysteine S-methyltransferase
MNPTYVHHIDSPLGTLTLLSDGDALTGVYMPSPKGAVVPDPTWVPDPAPLEAAAQQLNAYFAGELREFDLPTAASGTAFQQQVWKALTEIPYGQTCSYRDIAERIGSPKAVRAVGLANGRNPISIIVPCHRVVGANGSLTGYGGGLTNKQLLLDLERRVAGERSLLDQLVD